MEQFAQLTREKSPQPTSKSNGQTGRKLSEFLLVKGVKSAGALASLGLLLFVLAGRVDIFGFWIYILLAISYQVISLLIIVPRYPAFMDLDDARRVRRTDVKDWDKVVLWALAGAAFLMYGVAALDLGHLHIGEFPVWLAIPGAALYIAGNMLIQWAMVHNPHFERGVRTRYEQGHSVARTGPYRFVRHPGYLGMLSSLAAFPLISGSMLALFAGALGMIAIVARTRLEDGTLQEELAGYMEYAQKVRYRLVPFVW